jgi:hypothetical protein
MCQRSHRDHAPVACPRRRYLFKLAVNIVRLRLVIPYILVASILAFQMLTPLTLLAVLLGLPGPKLAFIAGSFGIVYGSKRFKVAYKAATIPFFKPLTYHTVHTCSLSLYGGDVTCSTVAGDHDPANQFDSFLRGTTELLRFPRG